MRFLRPNGGSRERGDRARERKRKEGLAKFGKIGAGLGVLGNAPPGRRREPLFNTGARPLPPKPRHKPLRPLLRKKKANAQKYVAPSGPCRGAVIGPPPFLT
ncbi:uncharacterized protein TM35_000292060 [Trypanosoma theileri]|uniref:Uncharacterized protein n=1 Tax=Trypanosoma theileri TaxID=67003 RepID=A0A1X0NNP1_9TRYP|nr:uncharacterized protein TM35_000292060 [Trypanosoma theileri]ORC86324.1 hypothetical protein TM35_000292060 [Trypanosoma theileri]